jgi:hypothetical protein
MRKAADRHKALATHTAIQQIFVSKKEPTKFTRGDAAQSVGGGGHTEPRRAT